MSHAMKAALWSGLFFPGVGHIKLKHYKRGIVLIGLVFIGLSILFSEMVQQANAIAEKIMADGGTLSMQNISKAAVDASTASAEGTLGYMSLLLLICWVVGIIDAYRLGHIKDIAQ